MTFRLIAAGLVAVLVATSTTSTHDDPIIIRGGSVIFNFGLATKAFANSGLWAEPVNGKWVYFQHTHMGAGAINRTLQTLGQGRVRNMNLMQMESEKLLETSLDLASQRRARIEIFLKGVPVGGTQAVDLPNGPQIVLEAVDLSQPGSNPYGYKGVPCCAHPGFAPTRRPQSGRVVDRHRNSTVCKELLTHANADPSTLTWGWKVTANRKLEESAGGATKKPGSERYFVEAQYKDPAYSSITLDSYSAGLVNKALAGGLQHLNDARGKRQNRIPFGVCPALELCATEMVNSKYCELSTKDCKVNAGFNPQ
jgi:hypothetical protein